MIVWGRNGKKGRREEVTARTDFDRGTSDFRLAELVVKIFRES